MLTFFSFLFVLSILILVHEWGHFIVARSRGVKVERFSFGFGPKLLSVKRGDTEYSISLFLIGGYVKMAGETPNEFKGASFEYLAKKPNERALVVIAGPVLNYILAFVLFVVVCIFGNPTLTAKIGKVLDGLPAQKAGLLVNDIVVGIDGKKIDSWDEMTAIVHKSRGVPLRFKIQRHREELEVVITPTAKDIHDPIGRKVRAGVIGITPEGEIIKIRYGFFEAFKVAGEKLFGLTALTYKALWAMITGSIPVKDSLTGPIGIFFLTGEAAKLGFVYLLHMMGVLSMSLAIFNVLPFPVLDGGHLFFIAVEKLRGRPISERLQEAITQVGVYILIFAMAFVFYNDLVRFGIVDKIFGRFF